MKKKIFNDLERLLTFYNIYQFDFDVCRDDNSSSEAFNILLVITNARDAMLMQSFEDQSIEQQGSKAIQTIMKERFVKLTELLKPIKNIQVLMDRDYDVWIYNIAIKEEVKEKFNTSQMTDVLRYGCQMPPDFVNVSAGYFKYNNQYFMGICFQKKDTMKMKPLLNEYLLKFQPLAKKLGGQVSLTFKSF